MEHVIDLVFRQENEIGNVVLDEMEILVPGQVANVRRVARDQIVDRNDAMAFRQQTIGQMRSQKTSAASHNRNGLRLYLGHAALYLPARANVGQQELARKLRSVKNRLV